MKRSLSAVLAGVLSLAVIAGCSSPSDTYKKASPTPAPVAPGKEVTLKIGQLPIVDGLPFWVGDQKGYFKQQGVNVELIKFQSANDRDTAIMSGQIDGMLADVVATTSLVGNGTKVQIASLSLGAKQEEGPLALLAAPNSGITKVEELKGQEIAVSNYSVMHYSLEKMLLDAGFKPDEIKLVSIPQIPVRFESLMSGKVKAAILPDPLFSLAAHKGAKLLLNDATAKQNYSQSVIVFTDKAMNEKLDAVKRFFLGYNLAVADIAVNPDGYKEILAEKASLPAEIKEAYKVVPFPMAQAPRQAEVEGVVQWLLEKQIIKSKVEYSQLVNPAALPQK